MARGLTSALALAAALAAAPAWAMQVGTTPDGMAWASGGVSEEETTLLHARRHAYSLWVVTAALGNGAFLADARVIIRDAQSQRVLFDRALDGPWLLMRLPLGRFVVEAQWNGQVQTHTTTIHADDLHQAFFYFKVPGEARDPNRPPPARNLYDGNGRP